MNTEYARLPRESLRRLVQTASSKNEKPPALREALVDGHEALADSE